jgi:hypothetical protein
MSSSYVERRSGARGKRYRAVLEWWDNGMVRYRVNQIALVFLMVFPLIASGCATLINGKNQDVVLISKNPPSRCLIGRQSVTIEDERPHKISLGRDRNYLITCDSPGEPNQQFIVAGRLSFLAVLDMPIFVFGLADFLNGSAFHLAPDVMQIGGIDMPIKSASR